MAKKCIFNEKNCIKPTKEDTINYDVCRNCKKIDTLLTEKEYQSEFEFEKRMLCAISGFRNKRKEEYGNRKSAKPKWFKKLLDEFGNWEISYPCSDHLRYLENFVISEPYNVSKGEIEKLIQFCEKNNLSFYIDGNSAHFTGRTFRIIIGEPSQI